MHQWNLKFVRCSRDDGTDKIDHSNKIWDVTPLEPEEHGAVIILTGRVDEDYYKSFIKRFYSQSANVVFLSDSISKD